MRLDMYATTRVTFRTIVIAGGLGILLSPIAIVMPANADSSGTAQPTESQPVSGNNCTNGEKIDATTAEQALVKFRAAGYSDVQILEKGCDNFWHATGTKGGQSGNIVLSPDGMVRPEGN
jgi:hypothetical protein